ncbi:hypothetical protein CGZ98_03575 [Enemella evansiae]|uniref:nucleotide disphospho-sugar-binding domain-containing protein n=1 Tax=Enemella evansiae TaxID=2016499 RepID=UPI000B95F14A|nr:nucleotide disphospho-sugar-binding domain-containing protein [Enemella evansiae]OYO15500.1 hypothetical protein CGZ98_03575 [Enemella evansiae]
MRVMIVVWPAASHLFPNVPLAKALVAAGHEVRVASAYQLADDVKAAALDCMPLGGPERSADLDLETVFRYALPDNERDELIERLANAHPDSEHARHYAEMFATYLMTSMRMFHLAEDWAAADDLVTATEAWRPDLVLWDALWPSAPFAARRVGAAHARLLWGPDYCAWAIETMQRLGWETSPFHQLTGALAAEFADGDDDPALLVGDWTIEPTPQALRIPTQCRLVEMRRIPYTGIGEIPDWLYPVPDTPRVVLTLGMSRRNIGGAETAIGAMLEMLGGMDVEVVATLNEEQRRGQTIPPNVRTVDYISLNMVLPTCAAIIHHGGGGTLTAALAHSVPQLIDVGGAESMSYNDYALQAGAAEVLDTETQSIAEMRRRLQSVIDEPRYREGTRQLRLDWLAQPRPGDVVTTLEAMTEELRRSFAQ